MRTTQENLRELLEVFEPGNILPGRSDSLHIEVVHIQNGAQYKYEPVLKHKTTYRKGLNEPLSTDVLPTLVHRGRTSFTLQWISLVEGIEFDDGDVIDQAVVFDVRQEPAKGIFSIIASREKVIQAIDKGSARIV